MKRSRFPLVKVNSTSSRRPEVIASANSGFGTTSMGQRPTESVPTGAFHPKHDSTRTRPSASVDMTPFGLHSNMTRAKSLSALLGGIATGLARRKRSRHPERFPPYPQPNPTFGEDVSRGYPPFEYSKSVATPKRALKFPSTTHSTMITRQEVQQSVLGRRQVQLGAFHPCTVGRYIDAKIAKVLFTVCGIVLARVTRRAPAFTRSTSSFTENGFGT